VQTARQVLDESRSYLPALLKFRSNAAAFFHPQRSAQAIVDGGLLAQFGQIDQEIAVSRKLKHDVFIAELYLDRLYKYDLRQIRYEPLPRYPAVERDFSFIFSDSVSYEKIEQAVAGSSVYELRSFEPVEIFRGGGVPAGHYSILVRATFQSDQRTLSALEVEPRLVPIIQALQELGGIFRAPTDTQDDGGLGRKA